MLAGSAITAGPASLGWWLGSFTNFATSVPDQGDIPTLAGLYVGWAPHILSVALVALSLTAAGALTVLALRRYRHAPEPLPVRSLAWLWLVWFLAAPYGHFADEVFLAPVLLSVFRGAGSQERVTAILLLYAAVLSVLVQNIHPSHMALLCLLPLAGLLTLIAGRHSVRRLVATQRVGMGGQAPGKSSSGV